MPKKYGNRNVSVEDIKQIISLSISDGFVSRSDIADTVGVGEKTVYNYQKYFDVV